MEVKIRALSEYKDMIPNTPELITGFMDSTTLTMLYAPSGGMKSLFALGLAHSLATGQDFLGFNTRKSKVLYVDAEMSAKSISKRCDDMGMGSITSDSLGYVTPEDGPAINLISKDEQEDFIEIIRESDYELIILDNLRTLFLLRDENDAAQFSEINTFLVKLRALGKSVLVLHHTNKGAEIYAGSTNIETPYDAIFGLIENPKDTKSKRIKVTKNRNGVEGLQALDNQYVTFSEERFHLNGTGLSNASIIEPILDDLLDRRFRTIKSLALTFQEAGAMAKGGQHHTYTAVYEFIRKNSLTGKIESLSHLTSLIKDNNGFS